MSKAKPNRSGQREFLFVLSGTSSGGDKTSTRPTKTVQTMYRDVQSVSVQDSLLARERLIKELKRFGC